jgi:hypothetical protein
VVLTVDLFYTDEKICFDETVVVFNYGLKTFSWVIIFVWVTFPVTSFLLRGGTYLVGFKVLRDGSFDRFTVGKEGFFSMTGYGFFAYFLGLVT